MVKQIPDEYLDKLRSIPIDEVAETYFKLNQMGSIFQTTCIHKGDNSPSLTFFPNTNTFFCFGCGAGKRPKTEGSDVISFVMWIDNCSFSEAVRKLSDMKGWEVPKANLSPQEKQRLQELDSIVQVNRTYWETLQTSKNHKIYLHERGIRQEEIDKWRIGMAPEGDKFAHRISFALMNDWGQTVGFSYRNMSDFIQSLEDDRPKYVNSPKSLVFDKGSILYGLNFVKRTIREKGYVIVGEGFGDAIIAQRVGLPFVSTMGTSLTSQHVEILKQYTNTIILWMDGDKAGIEATMRHAKVLRDNGFIVKALNFTGEDPDDVILKVLDSYSEEDAIAYVQKLVHTEARLASHFAVEHLLRRYESSLTALQLDTIAAIQPTLNEMQRGPEKLFTMKRIADTLGVQVEDLYPE